MVDARTLGTLREKERVTLKENRCGFVQQSDTGILLDNLIEKNINIKLLGAYVLFANPSKRICISGFLC